MFHGRARAQGGQGSDRVSPLHARQPTPASGAETSPRKIRLGPAAAGACRPGVCAQPSFASFIATVVEAEVDEQGEVHLRRVTSAVDTGIAINPDTIVAQLEGGLIFGDRGALMAR